MSSIHRDALDVFWSAKLNQHFAGPLLVSGDLLILPTQAAGASGRHAAVHAISLRDGSIRWERTWEYALVSGLAVIPTLSPARAPALILVATTSTDLLHGEGALVALDPAGEERWCWAPGVQRVSAPAMAEDVACATVDARTFVILDRASGEEQARADLGESASLSAPALARDMAVIPCRGPHLLAVGLDGVQRWRFEAEASADAWLDKTPVVVGEHVYTVLTTGTVLALQVEDGSLLWRADVGPEGKPLSPPATDGERLFVGARDGLHALALDGGRELWAFPTERRITAAPVASGSAVYVACHDHHLYVLDAVSGQELWRFEVGRRIEVPAVLVDCGESPVPCVVVADRGGTVTAVARPLSAAEHEAAGHWVEAATAYADLGQVARGAELLEAHGEPLEAAVLWEGAGYGERAARQYEAAGEWQEAADLWSDLGQPLKHAGALERHARSLEEAPCGDEERAQAWAAAARIFEAEGEVERAAACQREIARWRRQPMITVGVEHGGLVVGAWSRLRFSVRNEGYGPARNLIIHASGDQFAGQVTATRQISNLREGRERTDWLDVCPRAHGDSVPLRVRVEYADRSGEPRTCEQTVYVPVAQAGTARGVGGVVDVCTPPGDLDKGALQIEEASMSRKYLSKLRQMLAEYFSEGDLRTLCFDLGMDYDDLPGQGKANKARELVAYLDRRGRIPELVGMCQELRPNVAWGESRDRDGKVPSPSTARSAGMDYELGLQTLGTCLSGDALDEFRVFESRLRENLQRERLYGSTETTRADRAAIVDALNRLAQVHLGTSFNDLCQGTASPATSAATPHRASAGSERELASLRRQLAEACENLELIRERKSQFVMETTIPLDLIKQERRLEEKINHLEAEIARLGGSTSTGRASGSSPGGVQINSGGGAVILGDVNVEGGDFVGRDKVDRSKGDLD